METPKPFDQDHYLSLICKLIVAARFYGARRRRWGRGGTITWSSRKRQDSRRFQGVFKLLVRP